MKLAEAAEYLAEKAKKAGVTDFDILGSSSESFGLEVFEKNISNTEINIGTGIGIRLFSSKKMGLSYTERFTKESIDQCLKDAVSNSEITDILDLDLPVRQPIPDVDLKTFSEDLEKIEFNDLADLCFRMEKAADGKDQRIENIPYIGSGKSRSEYIFLNSNDVRYHLQYNSVSAYIGITSAENGQKKMGMYSNAYRKFSEFNPDFFAGKAIERSVELLGAKPVTSAEYPVILSNRVSASLIGMFLSPYFAESVQKKQSRLAGRLNEKIGSAIVSLVSKPHLPEMPGSRLLDGEGVPTKDITLLEKGVLKNFLYHLESAKKDGVAPTGSGQRSYSGKAYTSVSNLFFEKGNENLGSLMKKYPKCILITKLEGSSGCSALSGDISIGVQGFLVENGEKVHPVDGITMNTNYFDLLHKISAASGEYSDSYSSIKVPDLLIESVNIAG